jgi:2-pyrone-4,6-dicarboxylate lactonase
MPAFTKDAKWIDWCPQPSRPVFMLPPGSVDAHCHVFGPGDLFPFAPERKYTPCDATCDQLFALRDFLGFQRNVIVQATCHGSDNRAMLDALSRSNGKARGVATVNRSVTDEELQAMHAAGVRAVRFNFVRRLVDALPFDSLSEIAARVAQLGWHVVIYFEAQDLAEYFDFFTSLPARVVVDHMGRPDVSKDAYGPDFDLFVKLMEGETFWCKTTCPERLSKQGPPRYDDVVPFARRIIEAFPERVLWGTDWPHPNMTSHMPDDGALVNYIPRVATTQRLQKALLVDNPMKLYWPEETQ